MTKILNLFIFLTILFFPFTEVSAKVFNIKCLMDSNNKSYIYFEFSNNLFSKELRYSLKGKNYSYKDFCRNGNIDGLTAKCPFGDYTFKIFFDDDGLGGTLFIDAHDGSYQPSRNCYFHER